MMEAAYSKSVEIIWRPRRNDQIILQVRIIFSVRRECEWLEPKKRTNVWRMEQIWTSRWWNFTMNCRSETCLSQIVFYRQPQSGQWKLRKVHYHRKEWYRQEGPSGGQNNSGLKRKIQCTATFTQNQVVRKLVNEMAHDPCIPSRWALEFVFIV